MTRHAWTIAIAITALVWAGTAVAYPRLPERVPIHWNLSGEVDGWGDRSWAAFLTPALMLGMLGLFAALPWLSPRRFEIDGSNPAYRFILLLIVALFGYIQALTILAGLGGAVDVGRALVAGICLTMAMLGGVLGKLRRNFYVGVRTPWTLASDRVWADTHRLAGRLFVGAGLVGLGFSLLGWLPAAFGAIMAAALVSVVYSLIDYKRLEKRGELQ